MDQTNRPRTRGLEASEAEEDAKLIKAALAEPAKHIKKPSQNRGGGRGRNKVEESDEEEKLFYEQPAFDDDDETEVKPGTRKRRGMWRRGNVRKKAKISGGGSGRDGGGEDDVRRPPVSGRLAAILREELRPKIVPYNKSVIEYRLVWYKLGDIVTIQREDMRYFAQILGFHTDQFCERYVSIRWLLPKYKLDPEDPQQPPVTADSFKGSVPEDEQINMNSIRFVLRPPAYHFTPENPNVVTRNKFYVYNNRKCIFDSPSPTLTSAERRY